MGTPLYIGGSSDFCGFEFCGVHSSTLGIYRVSNNGRYDDNTVPNIDDRTMTVPGMTGVYYFETQYKQKVFNIQIAFDRMTEEQYRQFRQVFNGKAMGNLIFDEAPYKAYTAKVMNPPQLKTICFDEGPELFEYYTEESVVATRGYSVGDYIVIERFQVDPNDPINNFSPQNYIFKVIEDIGVGDLFLFFSNLEPIPLSTLRSRVYKGEGTIQLVAYYPFAHSLPGMKGLNSFLTIAPNDDYNGKLYLNKNEWAAASGMLATDPSASQSAATSYSLYNPGDLEADWEIRYTFSSASLDIGTLKILRSDNVVMGQLAFNQIARKSVGSTADYGLRISSRSQLVEGINSAFNPTGTIYNGYIASGKFFKIPQTIYYPDLTYTMSATTAFYLNYNYLYY